MRFTEYFEAGRMRPDPAVIRDAWVRQAVERPCREAFQEDGRIRRWVSAPEMGGRYHRVILLAGGETVRNSFFDRSFKP